MVVLILFLFLIIGLPENGSHIRSFPDKEKEENLYYTFILKKLDRHTTGDLFLFYYCQLYLFCFIWVNLYKGMY